MTLRPRGIALAWVGMALLLPFVVAALVSVPMLAKPVLVALVVLYFAALAPVTRAARRLRAQWAENERLALYDPVTDLPNRTLFHDRVYRAAALAGRRSSTAAVLLIDLDRFKEINDTLGHHNGDLLLHRVGERLLDAARASDSVARLGGDEFAVLLSDVDGAAGARDAAVRLREAISRRVELEGIGVEVEASVGVALYPDHGADPEQLLQRADVAMYSAKELHTGVEVYSTDRDLYSRDRLELMADLRQAIDNGEIGVHFQPVADLSTTKIVGVEALVRWDHPRQGFLHPDRFMPFAELTGLIRPLTLHVLDVALGQCRAWQDEGLEVGVAVNLSTRNLLDLTIPDELELLLARHDVPASMLEMEITETAIMADPPRAKAVLARLSDLGVGMAIDDFGIGYTALSWLRDLPITSLKIDRSFVIDMSSNEGDAVIVRSTVQLGRNLGLSVVAEGVEDEATWKLLRELGCNLAQGYHLSRPKPADELTAWLLERRSGPARAPESARVAL